MQQNMPINKQKSSPNKTKKVKVKLLQMEGDNLDLQETVGDWIRKNNRAR